MTAACSWYAPDPVSVRTLTERVRCSRVGVEIADVEAMDERHCRADRLVERQWAEVGVTCNRPSVAVGNACEAHVMFLDEVDGRVLS